MNNDMLPIGITANIKPEDIKWNGGDRISREGIKKIIVETLEKWADGYCYIEIPTDDAIKIMKSVIDNAQTVPLPNEQIAWEQGYEAGLVQGKHERRVVLREGMNNEDAIFILLNSNEYHHAKGDLPHSAASIEAFNKAIAALKAERKKGEWVYNEKLNMYYCKDCGLLEPFTKEEVEEGAKLPNFCQQCGADMRGEENGNSNQDT